MYDGPLQRLIDELSRLPGIGRKSAQRIAFHLLSIDAVDARRLGQSIIDARDQMSYCRRCFTVTTGDECSICRDPRRDPAVLCVVERPQDILVVEKTHEFRGRYHVLGGALAPLRGIGPDDLHVASLLERAASGVAEVVLATNPNVEGEATALYLARRLKPLGVRVTRIAFGLPVGAAIEFADEVTLGRSLSGRREV